MDPKEISENLVKIANELKKISSDEHPVITELYEVMKLLSGIEGTEMALTDLQKILSNIQDSVGGYKHSPIRSLPNVTKQEYNPQLLLSLSKKLIEIGKSLNNLDGKQLVAVSEMLEKLSNRQKRNK